MGKVIGDASDFFRLRIVRVDESGAVDMEWREDVLYRAPVATPVDEYDVWRVEAVEVDDDEHATVLATLGTAEAAQSWLDRAAEDLVAMTKSEFERTYFPAED